MKRFPTAGVWAVLALFVLGTMTSGCANQKRTRGCDCPSYRQP